MSEPSGTDGRRPDRPRAPEAPPASVVGAESGVLPPEAELPESARTERRASRWIATFLGLSILAGLGLLVIYALGGQAQIEGGLLFVLLAGIGFGLILWGKYLIPGEIVTEEREPHESPEDTARAAEEAILAAQRQFTRRAFLVRMLLGAFGAMGVAAIFPIRSLGPGPASSLFHTSWRRGLRLVDLSGLAVRSSDLEVGGVLTVFPEGHVGDPNAQAILVRVLPGQLQLPDGRNADAPDGLVCYSKLCTHAGCSVGLYLKKFHELQCPCHFSAFNVLNGAQPVFGPAARPLPQLPIEIGPDGFLVAKGDFTAPVGPGFWNRGSGP